MSPYDVWTGTVRQIDGKANLVSDDTTCTFPPNDEQVGTTGILTDGGWNFKTAYDNVDDSDPLEGYIEVFEIGSILKEDKLYVDSNNDDVIDKDDDMLYTAGVVHGSDGVPGDCSVVVDAWTNGIGKDGDPATSSDFRGDANGNLHAPNGGLYGMTIFLDLINGGAYVADPVAIDNWSTVAQHYRPDAADDFLLPSLASGNVTTSARMTHMSTLSSVTWPASVDVGLNDGDSQTPRSGTNPGPVAHVLATNSIANDYFVDPAFDGATDWVVTFPMRKHGIFDGKWTSVCDKDATSDALGEGTTEAKNACFKDSDKDVNYSVAAYNREEATRAPADFDVSPVLTSGAGVLPREVNIINFSAGDSVLGSVNAGTINTGTDFLHGWAKLGFGTDDRGYEISNANLTANDDGSSSKSVYFFPGTANMIGTTPVNEWTSGVWGVPAIGFAAIRGSDGAGSGPTFGETTPHAYER
jgi:hypothetical protein